MKFVNTDGMAFIGPGSEWFWTALQLVIVAVTLLGLYRQLHAQNGANALQRMEALQGRWESTRMIHARLVIVLWRKHATGPTPGYEAQVAMNWVLGFFEDLGDLEESGYITWPEVQASWGPALVQYWAITGPTVQALRSNTSNLTFSAFERLALRAEAEARARGEDWSIPEAEIPAVLETQIGRNTARLRMLRDIESGVIPTDAMFGEAAPAIASE